MDKTQILLGGLGVMALLAAVLYVITVYNSLVALRLEASRAWANIDVLLEQRFDELPNLVEVCKAYMKHERETLESVIAARAAFRHAVGIRSKADATSRSTGTVRQLFALAERYPDLKADRQFDYLRQRITNLEDRIADRRETYNDVVNTYNVRIEVLPDMVLARLLRYDRLVLFEVSEHKQASPEWSIGGP